MFFDARAAKLLKPGEHLVVDGCPGLRLEAVASGKTWTYRYRAPATGKLRQVRIGAWPAMPAAAALARWQEMSQQRAAGADPGDLAREVKREARGLGKGAAAAANVYTTRRLVEDYISGQLVDARKAAGADAAARALRRLLQDEPSFADGPPAAVSRSVAFDLLDKRRDTPTATAKLRSLLGAAWEYALDAGRIEDTVPNWWRQVMRGRLKSKGKVMGGEHTGVAKRTLRLPELQVLLPWGRKHMYGLASDMLVVYLWTCARGAEISSMRAELVTEEVDGWWWTVPKAETKNAGNERAVDLRVPLIGRALEVVQRRMDMRNKSGWLFEGTDEDRYGQHRFSTYIYDLQPYSAKAQRRLSSGGLILPVTSWTPHDLRRTGRTLLASLGCPKEIGEAILGHLPELIEGTYNAYSYDRERRLWLQKLSDLLEPLAQDQSDLPARP